MISNKRALVLCMLYSAAFKVSPVEPIKLNNMQKAFSKDSWQDFFGEDTHIQQASIPKLDLPTDGKNVQVKVETEFQKAINNAKTEGAIVDFLFGILLLTAAFPTIWMNERRQVKMYRVISKAENDCVDIQDSVVPGSVIEENDNKLVRLQGRVTSADGVTDGHVKAVNIANGLCLERVVEKYEEKEVKVQSEGGVESRTTSYNWVTKYGQDSQSPSYDASTTFYAPNARIGEYLLSPNSLKKLQKFDQFLLQEDNKSKILEDIKRTYNAKDVQVQDGKIMVRMSASASDSVGDYKISWQYIPADKEYTVMAQQMKVDVKGTRSFRQWNPYKQDVAWGEDNGSYTEEDAKDEGVPSGYYCCLIAGCVEKLMKLSFQEVINEMKPGIVRKDDVIHDLNQQNALVSTFFRFGTWICICWGTFLLFSPIISLFKFIPLIGYFLGAIVSFAAVVFALIIGSVMHLLVLTVAWIFYRPLFGIGLLFGVSLLLSLLFLGGSANIVPK